MPTITKYIQSDPIIFPFQCSSSILHGFVRNVKNIGPYIAIWILFIREVSELIPETHVWCSLIKRYIYRYFWKSVIFRKSHMSDCEHSCVFFVWGKNWCVVLGLNQKAHAGTHKKMVAFQSYSHVYDLVWYSANRRESIWLLMSPTPFLQVLPGTAGSLFSSMGFLSHTSPVHGVKNAHSGGPR